jgi:hypothetical protein
MRMFEITMTTGDDVYSCGRRDDQVADLVKSALGSGIETMSIRLVSSKENATDGVKHV